MLKRKQTLALKSNSNTSLLLLLYYLLLLVYYLFITCLLFIINCVFNLFGFRISISDFEILKALSHGAFGKVCLAKKVASGDLFAIKIIDRKKMVSIM
jgi:serine/threonine protein kinase